MSPKSRANEARKRRRIQREMRRIFEMTKQDDISSSDDDIGNTLPSPVPAHVLANNSNSECRCSFSSPSGSDGLNEAETGATEHPRASPVRSQHKRKRSMRGRRLLYGQRRGEVLLTDSSSVNDESFSDNAARNADSDDQHTDLENDNAFEGRPASSSDLNDSSDTNNVENDDELLTFRERIAMFVTKHSLSIPATAVLLGMFKSTGVQGIPKDRRALLRTPRTIRDIANKCGGTYKYLGLEKGMVEFLNNNLIRVPADNTISFYVNLDGVPLYKSRNAQFWPLLCRVGRSSPFIVALYYGEKKPDNIRDYLQDFIEEYMQLSQLGFSYQGNRYNVKLRCWICDAPARCLLKCVKGHTGHYACERCKAPGVYNNKRITYPPNILYESRTDEGFAAMAYHNAPDGDTHQNGERCPLLDGQLNCVSDVVVDCQRS